VVPLLSAFSALKLEYNITSGTTSLNFTEAYSTVYASPTTYKIDLEYVASGANFNSTAWILRNGTALAVDQEGYNLTGSASQSIVDGLLAGFSAEIQLGSELSQFTSSQSFHSNGNSTVTLGTNTFTVTNYVANTLPQTVTACGITTTLTGYSLSVGEPQGSSFELVTYAQLAGTTISGGIATEFAYSIQIVSLTVA
jgi:hypothetical protein